MTSKNSMIDVYSWATPNGHKVHIMLEECGYRHGHDWRAIPIDIGAGDQFKKEFLAISPNNKIPALVDPHGPDGKPISLFESGAILIYLAAKCNQFLPRSDREKYEVLQWLMFQMGGVGPMFGQTHHFRIYAPEKIDYAVQRYTKETQRLYGVMDKQLAKHAFIAGKDYSIADIALFPWTRSWKNQGVELTEFPHVHRWHETIAARPAVLRALEILTNLRKPLVDDTARNNLFGDNQYKKR